MPCAKGGGRIKRRVIRSIAGRIIFYLGFSPRPCEENKFAYAWIIEGKSDCVCVLVTIPRFLLVFFPLGKHTQSAAKKREKFPCCRLYG